MAGPDDLVAATKRAAGILTGQSAVNAIRGALAPAPAAPATPAHGPHTPSLASLATSGAAVCPTVVNTPTGNLTKMPFPR
jgi:hypothetical protein